MLALQYPGYEQAAGPDPENGADTGTLANTGSPAVADADTGDTGVVSSGSGGTCPDGGCGTLSDDSDEDSDDSDDFNDDDEDDQAVADQYSLSLECKYGNPGVYWANWDDYVAGLLSVDYKLTNNGPGTAHNLHIETATASSGVTLGSLLPDLGCLQAGDWTIFTLKWHVPGGVQTFTTQLTICSGCDDEASDDDSDDNSDDEPDDDSSDNGLGQVDDNSGTPTDNGGNPTNNSSDNTAVSDNSSSNGTYASNFSLTAAVERGSLPMTGLSLLTAILLALGAVTPLGLFFMPIAKLIRVRRK